MKSVFGSLLVIALVLGCQSSRNSEIGNGFLLRASGITGELNPAVISLHLKKAGRVVDVWPALTASRGGPVLIEEGLLFCARNKADRVALFASDERGRVAEITPHIQPGLKGECVVRQIKDAGDRVQVDLWDGRGQPISAFITKSELMQIALRRIADGEKVLWGKSEFYR